MIFAYQKTKNKKIKIKTGCQSKFNTVIHDKNSYKLQTKVKILKIPTTLLVKSPKSCARRCGTQSQLCQGWAKNTEEKTAYKKEGLHCRIVKMVETSISSNCLLKMISKSYIKSLKSNTKTTALNKQLPTNTTPKFKTDTN